MLSFRKLAKGSKHEGKNQEYCDKSMVLELRALSRIVQYFMYSCKVCGCILTKMIVK